MSGFVTSAALRAAWHPVAESADVAPGPIAASLLGERFAVWRTPDGTLAAAPDRCPHREAPLSAGTVSGGVLTCAYHGWSFGAGGRCVGVPSSGEGAAVPPAADLACVRAAERYGLIWLCPGEPAAGIPVIPEEDDPAFRRINSGFEHWSVSAPRMVDNFCDISHFPWVHAGTFGAGQDQRVPRVELAELDHGWYGYRYEVDVADAASGTAATVHRTMSTGFQLPFAVRSTIAYAGGLRHVLLLCSTPVDDVTSLFTFVVWRNDDFGVDGQQVIAFDRAIGAEDRRMLERIPGTLPLGRTALVNVHADRCSVEWRRRFAALVGPADETG
ncbi:MAG TPA: aromatic ring-hydroxylating dioxygenase subunit alpha [Ilumatobacter sp.]